MYGSNASRVVYIQPDGPLIRPSPSATVLSINEVHLGFLEGLEEGKMGCLERKPRGSLFAGRLQSTWAVTYLPVLKDIAQVFPSRPLKEKTLNSFEFKKENNNNQKKKKLQQLS